MFSHQFYNVVHIVGIVLVMSALGALALHSAAAAPGRRTPRAGSSRACTARACCSSSWRLRHARAARFLHGSAFPGWLWVKIAVWVTLAAATFLPYRPPRARARRCSSRCRCSAGWRRTWRSTSHLIDARSEGGVRRAHLAVAGPPPAIGALACPGGLRRPSYAVSQGRSSGRWRGDESCRPA
jgi:hypothetical protein